MKRKSFVLASVVATILLILLVSAKAQSADLGARKKEATDAIAQAREIVRRLRTAKQPAKYDLDLLDSLLTRIEKATTQDPDAAGPAAATGPEGPETHISPPAAQWTPGFSKAPTKEGPVNLYGVNLATSTLRTFWLDRYRRPYGSVARLQDEQNREGYRLQFAINGGIFNQRNQPQGLYIEQGRTETQLDTTRPGANTGNFYLEPNGVFFVDAVGRAHIFTTQRFMEESPRINGVIRLAVQSGPALLVNGAINSQFTRDSTNRKKRSGVGILDDRRVIFGMSSGEISFYEFAALFAKLGCRDALYLDGGPVGAFYSRKDNVSLFTDSFLVSMIGVTEKVSDH